MAEKRNLNLDWRFHWGDAPDAGFMGYDDRAWTPVTLPHDWAVMFPFDKSHASGTGYLPGGTGWYRRHLTLGEDIAGKRLRLTFDGVYKHARVWVNSHYLGSHAYGYTGFSFDVTPFLRPGDNVIAVRAEHEDVADSRWYTGSGIDRDVWLTLSDPVCFREHGLFAETLSADEDKALLRVHYETEGAEAVRFRLLNAEGQTAAEAESAGSSGTADLTVARPRLWSPDSPALYALEAEALSGGQALDTERLTVGLRVFRFDPDEGFFLNGINLKLKGVCVHHDAGCLGAAVPLCVWERRLHKLKAMGCNALRTAHNPPDPGLLDLCDSLGLLVMDEAFDEWEGVKNKWWQGHNVYPPKHFGYGEDFPEWHERDLSAMVLRDRNHPSVILWSIGNEIDYPNDPYVTPLFREALGNNDANKPAAERLYDPRKPDASRLAAVAKELVDIVHRLDPTRPVTSALSFPELSNRTGFADCLDLSGYNYREHFYEADHAAWPGRVLLGSENSHDPAAWYAIRDKAYISGQFLWTGVDFLGECRGWPERISQAGALDLAGLEKPLYAQRQALWTDKPMARLAVSDAADEHGRWSERFRWEGEEGHLMRVSCYTSAPAAELFLNGASLGEKRPADGDGCRIVWDVPYAPGELRVQAGTAEDRLFTPGAAARLTLSSSAEALPADGLAVAQIEVLLTDADGHPARDEVLHCQPLGDLSLLGIENGAPDDLTPYAAPYRGTREGRAILYVRRGRAPGRAALYVWTDSGLNALWVAQG
ncbi:MAG: DUF4982 domain-containing protein [Clostridia bacterium]|nr:DUF4982 domain-containing protein [Clostridia bacterium]